MSGLDLGRIGSRYFTGAVVHALAAIRATAVIIERRVNFIVVLKSAGLDVIRIFHQCCYTRGAKLHCRL